MFSSQVIKGGNKEGEGLIELQKEDSWFVPHVVVPVSLSGNANANWLVCEPADWCVCSHVLQCFLLLQADWLWLFFPLDCAGLDCAFLVATAVESPSFPLHLWSGFAP